ncbi:MAG TPA: sulfite exporter TauE/SafE family protein [Acidimicrobiales bacterium]|nr:sulfite exporter TauE/SafE family protein [Acidimicrobiales bacterium]
MFVAALPLGWRLTIFLLAGVAAGIVNGVAGGGQFVTFPTLLALGTPALQANLSATVGIVPSYLGSLRVFRHQLRPHRELITTLIPWCLLGTVTGCAFLLEGSPSTFRTIVPWLIGAGTILFAASPLITRQLTNVRHDHAPRRWPLFIAIFLVSVYGGYFGAGLGIMLLAVMALALPLDVHALQVLRNALSMIINTTAALIFVAHGHLAVAAVSMLLVGSLVGGWLGALLIVRLSPTLVRALVIGVGVVTTVKLALG